MHKLRIDTRKLLLACSGLLSFLCVALANPEETNTQPGLVPHLEGTVFESSNWIDEHFAEKGLEPVQIWNTLGFFDGNRIYKNFLGRIEFSPYQLRKELVLYAGGPLEDPDVNLIIKDLNSDEQLQLNSVKGIDRVELCRWTLPRDWVGREVAIIAEDNNARHDSWIGISQPMERVPTSYQYANTPKLITTLLNLIAPLAVFLSIGLAGYATVASCWKGVTRWMPILVLCIPLSLSYLLFYLSIESLFLSLAIGIVATVLSVTYIIMGGLKKDFFPREELQYYVPIFCLTLLAVILANSLLFSEFSTHNPIRLSQERFIQERLPLDNYLPLLTLNRIWDQESLKPFIIEWKSTDRPPLQAAACLLVRPFFINPTEAFQVFSSWLHASTLMGVAFLLKSLRIPVSKMLVIAALILFSGTFLINTAFVWPKLFAIAFPLFLTGMLLQKDEFEANFGFWLLAGTASSLSMLIHPGSLFALVAILGVYTLQHRRISVWQIVAACLVFIVFMLPWLIYQKTYDPPGNYMQKRFFANYPYFDEVGFIEALKIGYGELTFSSWMMGRIENIKVFFGDFPKAFSLFFNQILSESNHLRIYIFNFIGISLIPTIAGYLALPFVFKQVPTSLKKSLRYLHLVLLSGLAIWILLILPSGRTIIHHGSYYFPILITLLCGLVVQHKSKLLLSLFAIQVIYYQIIWATPALKSNFHQGVLFNIKVIDVGSLIIYGVSLALTLWFVLTPNTLYKKSEP